MKEKSSNKKIKLEISSLEHELFTKLTDQELKEIKGGFVFSSFGNFIEIDNDFDTPDLIIRL